MSDIAAASFRTSSLIGFELRYSHARGISNFVLLLEKAALFLSTGIGV